MPYKEGQRTLMSYLGMEPMRKVVETRLFGGTYIRFSNFLLVASFLYESGAILGRAKRDNINELAKMVSVPGREEEFMNWLQEQAKKRLEKIGEEPNSFYLFFVSGELEKLGLSLSSDLRVLKKAFEEKWPFEKLEPFIKAFGIDGIGFGSSFPELTEKIYRNAHESIDSDIWSEARAYGVDIPEKPERISLEEREEIVLQMVAAYTSEFYPELLDSLDLRGYLAV